MESTAISHIPCGALHAQTTSPTINSPRQNGTIVTTDEPTWTHHYHPKSTVYIRVTLGVVIQSYGFGQMYLPLQYHTE